MIIGQRLLSLSLLTLLSIAMDTFLWPALGDFHGLETTPNESTLDIHVAAVQKYACASAPSGSRLQDDGATGTMSAHSDIYLYKLRLDTLIETSLPV